MNYKELHVVVHCRVFTALGTFGPFQNFRFFEFYQKCRWGTGGESPPFLVGYCFNEFWGVLENLRMEFVCGVTHTAATSPPHSRAGIIVKHHRRLYYHGKSLRQPWVHYLLTCKAM